jgi:phosphoribosyl 1,2-cyclic phosphodiesterase
MLWGGNYQYHVKKRIDSRIGHLSNTDSASYISRLVQNGATRIVLAHLSQRNNTPRRAYDSTITRLAGAGMTVNRDFTLDIAQVQTTGEYIAI